MSSQTKANAPFLCIELLESFSKKELKQFNQFISSPYFNTDIKLIQLFELIIKEVLNKAFTEALQYKVYSKVFDEKNENILDKKEKKILRTKLSKLNQLLHQFMVTERLKKKKNVFNDLLFTCLLHKRQFNAFEVLFKRDEKRLFQIQRKETEHFEQAHKIKVHYLNYMFDSDKIYKCSNYNFEDVLHSLDLQYIIKKLKLIVTIYSDNILSSENEISNVFFKMKIIILDIPSIKNHPYVSILLGVINFLQVSDQLNYIKLQRLLKQNQHQIPLQELKTFYLLISNYYISELRKGNTTFENDFTQLYLLLDNQNLLLTQSIMPAIKLKNIVVRMCKSNHFNQASYFIEKYLPFVEREHQNSIEKLCLSYISYYQKKLRNALDHIIRVESVNPIIECNIRILIMKIYFETDKDYSEKTERLYRSAEKFFKENKSLPSKQKISWKNFTQILINLYRFKHNEGKMTIEKLQTKLEQQEYNADKKWLLEKMDELKNILH